MKRANRGLSQMWTVKWLPATYEDDRNIKLGGQLTLIHPDWLTLFTRVPPGRLERMAQITERLGPALLMLLSVHPIGVVQEEKTERPRLLVVSEVDLFCLVVERRLDQIPVLYLPDNIDIGLMVRIDGLLNPLIRAHRSDADQVIRTILRAEQRSMPLIARKGYLNGSHQITIEDLAYLLLRDTSTIHHKLKEEKPKRVLQHHKDAGAEAGAAISAEAILPGNQGADGQQPPEPAMTTALYLVDELARPGETPTQGGTDTPLVTPPNHHPPTAVPAPTTGNPLTPDLSVPDPNDKQEVPKCDNTATQKPPPQRPTQSAKRTKRRVEDEHQGDLFSFPQPKGE